MLITKTGAYFGKSAVIPDDYPEANMSADVGKITLKIDYNPYFLSAFLNCHYGYSQLRRRGVKATRPRIVLAEFQDILVPKFSDDFDVLIERITRRGINTRTQATAAYSQAQSILASELGPIPHNDQNITTQSFSAVFETGRLDAEYFMPKYDDILAHISSARTVGTSCTIHGANFKPKPGTQYHYIELADVGPYGNITGTLEADGADLPTRARRIVHAGQVIVSSIEGSLQSCALVTEEHDGALCSTGFYVMSSGEYNPETLLMLFKSSLMQTLMKRGCAGTILASISEDELRNVRMPSIGHEAQKA